MISFLIDDIKIKEGFAADKIATSLRSKENARQAVRATKPSNQGLYHENTDLSSGKNLKQFSSICDAS